MVDTRVLWQTGYYGRMVGVKLATQAAIAAAAPIILFKEGFSRSLCPVTTRHQRRAATLQRADPYVI